MLPLLLLLQGSHEPLSNFARTRYINDAHTHTPTIKGLLLDVYMKHACRRDPERGGRRHTSTSRSRSRSPSRSPSRHRDPSRSPPRRTPTLSGITRAAAYHQTVATGATTGGRVDFCRDFQRGVCVRGAACRYSHEGNISQREHDFGSDMCRNFLAGRCDRVHCRYSHGGASSLASINHARGGDSCYNDSIRERFKIGVGGGASILGSHVSEVDEDDNKRDVEKKIDRYWKYRLLANE